jgi:hypothetical protein
VKYKSLIIELSIIVILLIAIWLVSFTKSFSSIDASIFEALTALFSLFAFIAVIVTFSLQYRQLQNQQEQIAQQNFETMLFNMLEAQRHIVEQIVYIDKGLLNINTPEIYRSREIFTKVIEDSLKLYFFESRKYSEDALSSIINLDHYARICLRYNLPDHINIVTNEEESRYMFVDMSLESMKNYFIKNDNERGWINYIFELISDKYLSNYNHYFHHLYHILNLIKQNEDAEAARGIDAYGKYKNYADIVRAQMSTAELWVLFYSSLSRPRMVKLLERYAFLKNVDKDSLLDPSHKEFYKFREER